MAPIIECQNVCFSYGDYHALHDVTFQVKSGEFIGIIGPNGGGKTTLLKLLMGFLEPEHGVIRLFGEEPSKGRRRVGYVPQNLKYDKKFPLSVRELVFSGVLSRLSWFGRFKAEDRRRVDEALKEVGLLELARRPIGTLSGGEFQRALIARALVAEPELLFLDEPTANVDAKAEAEIYRLLKELSQKRTILMVTHDLKASIELVDRVLCVEGTVSSFKAADVCEHFALGLYHAPLVAGKEKPCDLQVKKP